MLRSLCNFFTPHRMGTGVQCPLTYTSWPRTWLGTLVPYLPFSLSSLCLFFGWAYDLLTFKKIFIQVLSQLLSTAVIENLFSTPKTPLISSTMCIALKVCDVSSPSLKVDSAGRSRKQVNSRRKSEFVRIDSKKWEKNRNRGLALMAALLSLDLVRNLQQGSQQERQLTGWWRVRVPWLCGLEAVTADGSSEILEC